MKTRTNSHIDQVLFAARRRQVDDRWCPIDVRPDGVMFAAKLFGKTHQFYCKTDLDFRGQR